MDRARLMGIAIVFLVCVLAASSVVFVAGFEVTGSNKSQPFADCEPFWVSTLSNEHTFLDNADQLDGQKVGGSKEKSQLIIGPLIGQGTFADVFVAKRTNDGKYFALKVQNYGEDSPHQSHYRIENEHKLLSYLSVYPGFTKPLFFESTFTHAYIGLPLLGPSLQDIMELLPNKRFSRKTVLMIGKRLVKHLRILHTAKYLHTDLKPQNFLIGFDQDETKDIYLVDLGMVQKYTDSKGNHYQFEAKEPNLRGSLRYCSLSVHQGHKLSRRDDIESLCYVLLFLYTGRLPWQSRLTENFKANLSNVGKIKRTVDFEKACRGMPVLSNIIHQMRNLPFNQTPPYYEIIGQFDQALTSLGFSDDGQFDWLGNVAVNQNINISKKKWENAFQDITQTKWSASIDNLCEPKITAESKFGDVPKDIETKAISNEIEASSLERMADFFRPVKSSENIQEQKPLITVIDSLSDLVDKEGAIDVDVHLKLSENPYKLQQQYRVMSNQSFSFSQDIHNMQKKGFILSSIVSFPSNSTTVAIFSENVLNRKHSFVHARMFPFIWVECQWRKKKFITSLTGNNKGFYVSMSNYPCIKQQFILESRMPLLEYEISTLLPPGAKLTHRILSNGVFVHVYSEFKKCKSMLLMPWRLFS